MPALCVRITACVLLSAGPAVFQTAAAQTRPTQPTQPVQPTPSGGVAATTTVGGPPQPARGILFIPQFAPPGVQVPGGPPASNTPTLITPTVLGRY